MRGKFIVIEGDDGAGKTTFVKYLKERHPEYVYSREPGGSTASEGIRELLLANAGRGIDPITRFHLFWASRAENLAKVILPALAEGKIVVSDRFDASTFAYQIGGDGRRDLENLFWETRQMCLGSVVPNYIYFNVPMRVSEERLTARGSHNHFDTQGAEYRKEVARHYVAFFFDRRVTSRVSFASDKPKEEMLSSAYELFQTIVR